MFYDLYMVLYYVLTRYNFIKADNLFESLIIIFSTLNYIHSFLRIKLTTNLTITFSNIHYMKCICITSMFIKIIIFKTNYYILWSFYPTFHTKIKQEVSSIGYFLIKCFPLIIAKIYTILFT